MTRPLTASELKSIEAMLDNGSSNGKIALKYPGITKKQIAKIRSNLNPATPETKRKLKADPLQYLYRAEKLDSGDLISADRIRAAYLIITAGIGPRCASLETFIDRSRPPDADETEWQAMIQINYSDWHDACSKAQIKTGPVLHVLTEPVSLGDTDRHYRYKNGTSSGYIIKGLKLYSKLF